MAGAIAVGVWPIALANQRTRSVLNQEMQPQASRSIDRRLLGGSALFGIDWGLVGLCPGPAWVAIGLGMPKAVLFVFSCSLVSRRLPGLHCWRLVSAQRHPG
jgi:uncharacterized protein